MIIRNNHVYGTALLKHTLLLLMVDVVFRRNIEQFLISIQIITVFEIVKITSIDIFSIASIPQHASLSNVLVLIWPFCFSSGRQLSMTQSSRWLRA